MRFAVARATSATAVAAAAGVRSARGLPRGSTAMATTTWRASPLAVLASSARSSGPEQRGMPAQIASPPAFHCCESVLRLSPLYALRSLRERQDGDSYERAAPSGPMNWQKLSCHSC
eukprot:360255-Chlamydomonas_euryale.AAC.18